MHPPVKTDPELLSLMAAVRNAPPMTKAQRDEQRISFVYGQMMDCQPGMTKDEVRKILAQHL